MPARVLAAWLALCGCAQAQPASPPPAELNLVALPTTASLERHHAYFRLTHRFARDLTIGDFADLARDAFAFDNGAVLGLEFRFALEDDLHVGLHRSTHHKATQLFTRWDAVRQGDRSPIGLSGFASFEALDNLQDGHQPGAGLVVSRAVGSVMHLYVSPTYVYGTFDADRIAAGLEGGHDHTDHLVPLALVAHEGEDHTGHKATFFVGVGGRLRLRPTVFAAAEISPRLSGHDPGDAAWGVALEKVTRGHTLALTLTNAYATTPGQIARGGTPGALYLGFNIIRRF